MFTLKRLIGGCLFVFVLGVAALAQESRAPVDVPRESIPAAPQEPVVPVAPLVTATATARRVRFVSPGTVVQLRLEVFNQAGQKLFDTEQRGGNVLDWLLQDGAGERLPAGSYACVLTIKSLSGRISQRLGLVTIDATIDAKAAVEAVGTGELSMAQQQAIGPIAGPVAGSGESNAAFTVVQQSEAEALTTVTHDGTKGQLSRTRGPLSFRVGDVFSGKDKEQMRLTEDGRLGIGTSNPQAKLDVAGTIRAERVVIARPRSPNSDNQNSTSADTAQATDPEQPLASGSGTVDRVAKWTETGGAGTLGNTQMTELNGSLVVGNPSQTGNIQIYGTALQDVFAGMGPDVNVGPAFNYGYAGLSFGRSAGFFNVRPDALATPPNPSLRFMTANVERMIVTNAGNVGIGISNAASKLHVLGTQPPTVPTGAGTNAALVLQVIGAKGGNSDSGGPQGGGGTGGTGGGVLIQGGQGGDIVHGPWPGLGGSITLQPGAKGVGGFGIPGPGDGSGELLLAPTRGNVRVGATGFFAVDSSTQAGGRLLIGPSGGVGIGPNATDPALHVTGAQPFTAGANASMVFKVLGGKGASNFSFANAGRGADVLIQAGDGGDGGISNISGDGGSITLQPGDRGAGLATGLAGNLLLAPSRGKVGIGTNLPAYRLHIVDPSNQGLRVQTNTYGGAVASFGGIGDFQIDAEGTQGGRLMVEEAGNVGIGTNTPNFKLEVNGEVAGVGPYQDISDLRFKKDIRPLAGALSKVMRLRGVSFDWRRDEFPALNFSQGRQVGFIAQEIAGVLPEAVTTDNRGYYRMAYAEVTPVLVEAIKEQQIQLDRKDAEIMTLKAANAVMNARLTKIEQMMQGLAVKSRPLFQ